VASVPDLYAPEYDADYMAPPALVRGGSNFICLVPIQRFVPRPKKERIGRLRGAYRVHVPGAARVTDTKGNTYEPSNKPGFTRYAEDGWFVAHNPVTLTRGDSVTAYYNHCGHKRKIKDQRKFLRHMRREHGLL
jgi:hypothetical protein